MNALQFSPAGIANVVGKLGPHSVPGSNEKNIKLLRIAKDVMSVLFSKLFQAPHDNGSIPQDWKLQKIFPVLNQAIQTTHLIPVLYLPQVCLARHVMNM